MLSIIIPSHNRADLLDGCLRSVCQHVPHGSEVIVVDDASPGAAVSAVAERFAGIRVVRLRRRGGFCRAVNAGINAARGEIVELLNDDVQVSSGWADAALRWFSDTEVGAVAPLVLAGPAGRTVDSAGDRYYVGGVAGKRGHGRAVAAHLLVPRTVFGASASSAFYRRQALLEIGGFPESFESYFDDVDVAFRLGRAGYRTIFEPGSRVLHQGSSSHRRSRRLLMQQSRNEERVFWRNIPPALLSRAIPKHVLVLLGKAWRRWQEGTLSPWVWGRLQCLGEIADIRRHRRELVHLGSGNRLLVETAYWY